MMNISDFCIIFASIWNATFSVQNTIYEVTLFFWDIEQVAFSAAGKKQSNSYHFISVECAFKCCSETILK